MVKRATVLDEVHQLGLSHSLLQLLTEQFESSRGLGPWDKATSTFPGTNQYIRDLGIFLRKSMPYPLEGGEWSNNASPQSTVATGTPSKPPTVEAATKPLPALDVVEAIRRHPLLPPSFSATSVWAAADALRELRSQPSYAAESDELFAGTAIG